MARPKVNLVVLDPGSGKARPGAWVTVYQANTLDKAALFADDDVTTIGNPVQANVLGQVAVRIATGTYDVSMTFDGAQPTVVEDVLAWTPDATVITSPGDLIIGGPNSEPTRLAVGANGQALIVENGLPTWRVLGAGHGLPPGAPGSLLSYGPTGDLTSVLPGVQDEILVMAGGMPTWAMVLPAGQTLPINQPGDLVIGQVTTGVPSRLAAGNVGDVLTIMDPGHVAWAQPSASAPFGVNHGTLRLGTTGVLEYVRATGMSVYIEPRSRTIPVEGIGLSTAGLAANTLYMIYVAWVGNALVLEASTTGYVEYQGYWFKGGDATRCLVGMARTSAANTWVNTEKQLFVLTRSQGVTRSVSGYFTAPRSLATPTLVELHPELRAEFIMWKDDTIQLNLNGWVVVNNNGSAYSFLTIDGTIISAVVSQNQGPQRQAMNIAQSRTFKHPFDGYHFISMAAQFFPSAGEPEPNNATWAGDVNGFSTCRVHAIVPHAV